MCKFWNLNPNIDYISWSGHPLAESGRIYPQVESRNESVSAGIMVRITSLIGKTMSLTCIKVDQVFEGDFRGLPGNVRL